MESTKESNTTNSPVAPSVIPDQKTKPKTVPKPKLQPPHAVILHNDDVNRFEWVVGILIKVLRCGGPRAVWLTMRAHLAGRCVVWTGSLEVAEFKADQLRSCGADPTKKASGALPLRVTIEALPE
jgi:ATP-dependent Clp protease adaptor protein ClpS